ncbi:MAG: hypothetical protein ACO3A2_10435 [Bdellovibrionia bacterium]
MKIRLIKHKFISSAGFLIASACLALGPSPQYKVGDLVFVPRSDGTRSAALITGYNPVSQTYSVEWDQHTVREIKKGEGIRRSEVVSESVTLSKAGLREADLNPIGAGPETKAESHGRVLSNQVKPDLKAYQEKIRIELKSAEEKKEKSRVEKLSQIFNGLSLMSSNSESLYQNYLSNPYSYHEREKNTLTSKLEAIELIDDPILKKQLKEYYEPQLSFIKMVEKKYNNLKSESPSPQNEAVLESRSNRAEDLKLNDSIKGSSQKPVDFDGYEKLIKEWKDKIIKAQFNNLAKGHRPTYEEHRQRLEQGLKDVEDVEKAFELLKKGKKPEELPPNLNHAYKTYLSVLSESLPQEEELEKRKRARDDENKFRYAGVDAILPYSSKSKSDLDKVASNLFKKYGNPGLRELLDGSPDASKIVNSFLGKMGRKSEVPDKNAAMNEFFSLACGLKNSEDRTRLLRYYSALFDVIDPPVEVGERADSITGSSSRAGSPAKSAGAAR